MASFDEEMEILDAIDLRITQLCAAEQIGGFLAKAAWANVERQREKLKGRRLAVMNRMLDKESKPNCNALQQHRQICKCRSLAQAQRLDAQ